MTEYRIGLPARPLRMLSLPVDERGYPVPYFTAYINGKPDFRVVDPAKIVRCVQHSRCWICGDVLGRYGTFVLGVIGAINRLNAEPPSHAECASYAVRSCPFMLLPRAVRRDKPDGSIAPDGLLLERNPGVNVMWCSRNWKPVRGERGGVLFDIGDAYSVAFMREGRGAQRDEIMESIRTGIVEAEARIGADYDAQERLVFNQRVHDFITEYVP